MTRKTDQAAKRRGDGVETLDDLRQRCYVDEVSGCWHLRQANGRPMPIGDTREIWSRLHGTKVSVPRLAWLLAHPGKDLPSGHIAYRCCESYDCVAPAHIRAGTKRAWGRMLSATGRAATPAKIESCRAIAARNPNRKITDELKSWILDSSQSSYEIAAAIGCSKTIVHNVRKVQAKRPAASVFEFAMRVAA